jgi:hypothetical protein
MKKLLTTIAVCLIALSLHGCGSDDEAEQTSWHQATLWPRGSRPVPSPTTSEVLFSQEETPAGLYLLRDGTAFLLNPTVPAANSDYAWSRDGRQFAFSGPGQPGDSDAGIFVAWTSSPTQFMQLWDRGTHPRFMADGLNLVCAGPEDGSDAEGIWYITIASQTRERLAERGVSPEISPDGLKMAYLIPGGILGRVLVAANLETGHSDTLVRNALTYSWLGDSRSLVFETLVNDAFLHISVITVAERDSIPITDGTLPVGFPEGTDFVYTGLNGSQIAGLWIAGKNRSPTQISAIGTQAVPASMTRIVAQDTAGIIEFTAP